MKSKRKNIIKAGLLGAALMLGTGYATINNRILTATGTIPIAEKAIDVVITEAQPGQNYDVTDSGQSATLHFSTVSLSQLIEPGAPYPGASLAIVTIINNETDISAYIDVEISFYDSDGELLTGDFYSIFSVSIPTYKDGEFSHFANDPNPLEPGQTAFIEVLFDFYTPIVRYSEVMMEITITAIPAL